MKRWQTIQTVLLGILISLVFLSPAQAEDIYANATYVGKAHGPGCGKGFTDITGHCWECPTGYKHNNILLSPTNPKVCKKPSITINKKGIVVGKSTLGICKKGWLSTNNGKCYVCPNGYKHNIGKFGTTNGVCYKKTKALYSAAHNTHGSLVCTKGHFSVTKGGSCWTCPPAFPKRTSHGVQSDKACVSTPCGKQGERLCTISERILPCEKGTIPDFVKNECVAFSLKPAVCKALVTTLQGGKLPKGFEVFADLSRSKTKKKSDVNSHKLMDQVNQAITPYQAKVPEIKRIYSVMNHTKSGVKAMFSPNTFCNPTAVNRKLGTLGLKPNFIGNTASSDHFYMAYTLSFSLSAAAGLQGGFAVVTDYKGDTKTYVYLGPQLVSNASLSDSLGVQFFPRVSSEDFKGWGYDIGVSGGPPTKIVSGGADVAFNDKFQFQGFGVSGSIGLGVLPADIGIAATHSWEL